MGNFGRILDDWESNRSQRQEKRRDDWLDRYPPDGSEADGRDDGYGADHSHQSRAAAMPVDASIDLHGLFLAEALEATEAFISESMAMGRRKIRIIHGKGKNGEGVLRREVKRALETDARIGAIGYGSGSEGGRGAIWAVLRNREANARDR